MLLTLLKISIWTVLTPWQDSVLDLPHSPFSGFHASCFQNPGSLSETSHSRASSLPLESLPVFSSPRFAYHFPRKTVIDTGQEKGGECIWGSSGTTIFTQWVESFQLLWHRACSTRCAVKMRAKETQISKPQIMNPGWKDGREIPSVIINDNN